jgi:hypothetical protein
MATILHFMSPTYVFLFPYPLLKTRNPAMTAQMIFLYFLYIFYIDLIQKILYSSI